MAGDASENRIPVPVGGQGRGSFGGGVPFCPFFLPGASVRSGCPVSCLERTGNDAPGLSVKNAVPANRWMRRHPTSVRFPFGKEGGRPFRRSRYAGRSAGTTRRKSDRTFGNALTALPTGSAEGGSDFKPRGQSEIGIVRFCRAFGIERRRCVGPGPKDFGRCVRPLSRRRKPLASRAGTCRLLLRSLFSRRSRSCRLRQCVAGCCGPSAVATGGGGTLAADGRFFP